MRHNPLRTRHAKELRHRRLSFYETDRKRSAGGANLLNGLSPRGIVFSALMVCAFAMLLLCAGCSKKVVRKDTMVFDLDEVFKKGSGSVEAGEIHEQWRERALELARSGDMKEAVEAFERYVEQDPENYFGFNGLAVCYKRLKDQPAALTNFDRALELADTSSERAKVLGNIGNLYLDANQPQAALGYYKEAASKNKNHPYYLILIAYTFLKLGDHDRAHKVLVEAEDNIKRLKQLDNVDQGKSYYYLARCLLGAGEEDREKVYRYLKLALKADSERLLPRLKRDVNNGQSLFYTLKDDEDLEKLLSQFDETASRSFWRKKDPPPGRSQTRLEKP